ncbi:hypothetical protein H2201_006674 [Coniosporium apollinis]|uniref:Phytanoyl-CoA hydroxylase n=2 Tax=Coniosporium TaxID=2810619 RepID=A0ABQ9NPU1_9PEZI|nr:hypothetical protein H2199_003863 [Cladosporium sp. JES 115]KAJ9661123.1 hypothetical protein H2201_006674 [Coniosporium apollinis]
MAPGILVNKATSPPALKQGEASKPDLRAMFRDRETLELHSSGGPIDEDSLGWLEPTSKDTSAEQMRERYNRDGYLWVKGVLPKDDVWKMRETYLEYLPGLTERWMQPGKLRRKFGFQDQNTEYIQRMVAAHSEKWYRDFCAHPDLQAFVKHLTGWEDTTLLERSILRPNVPGGGTTQVHYNQILLRAGPPTSITAWVPIGDCAANGGGLLYLEDSVRVGQQLEREFNKAAESLTEAERISAFNETMMSTGYLERDSGKFSKAWNRRWLCADYEAGDIVLHNPFMIHSSAINEEERGVIRFATDLRYVEAGKPFDTRWMKTWVPGDGL